MRKMHYGYYRHPQTTAEKRANQDREYVRGKRLPNNLPDLYDDLRIHHTKSWKDKRKTQYVGRGKKHVIRINDERFSYWDVENYFTTHSIPYCVSKVLKPTYREGFKWKMVPDERRRESFPWLWPPAMKRVMVMTGEMVKYSVFDYYLLTWWSDKDIGIDYILRSTQKVGFKGYETMPD